MPAQRRSNPARRREITRDSRRHSIPGSRAEFWLALLGLLTGLASHAANGIDPTNGLVAHWTFTGAANGIVRDASPNGLDGRVLGATPTTGQTCYDGALHFDGIDDAVHVPVPGATPPEAISRLAHGTIAIRFRFPDTGSGVVIPLLYFGEAHAGTMHNSLIVEIGHSNDPQNRRLYFTIFNKWFCFDTATNLLPETWYHFVGVVGTNGNTGYLNGQEMTGRHYNLGSSAAFTNFFSSVPVRECLAIGYGRLSQEDPFRHGPATISDVRIYDRPLSAAKVSALAARCEDAEMFSISRGISEAGGVVLTWPSGTNYTYAVWSRDTTHSDWSPVPSLANLAATPPFNHATVTVQRGSSGFYRVEAMPR
jgi:hypothetical protein